MLARITSTSTQLLTTSSKFWRYAGIFSIFLHLELTRISSQVTGSNVVSVAEQVLMSMLLLVRNCVPANAHRYCLGPRTSQESKRTTSWPRSRCSTRRITAVRHFGGGRNLIGPHQISLSRLFEKGAKHMTLTRLQNICRDYQILNFSYGASFLDPFSSPVLSLRFSTHQF